ncbi:MAG: triose-phosphate isomerase, partial [Nitrospinaceae bacterium]|nr:triose-phosphate isomerase [Nitrospinaceae bacterium]NIR56028.1 triose-phosphate isomerase [Nitrospinaceae bacterium]NIT83307.1 triose-phosphate isomerase [Nitrospinaceae bacterium]NIW07091.1 triose-phosphate isomerase [Nitrospinaceae bacterium]NIX35676.1 triose-phosphate isomerase [Nitrospinaceae bacterium]
MNKTVPESLELIRAIREKVGAGCSSEVVVIPPFTSLFSVQEALRGSDLKLGAQNLSQSPQGALTGEVSGAMLISAG